MSKEANFYQEYLEGALKQWEWGEDSVEYNSDNNSYYVATSYALDNISGFRMFIETHPGPELIKIFLYSPISIPEKRYKDACVLINRLNKNVYAGALDLAGENVRFVQVIDVEGFVPEVRLLSNLRAAAGNAFRPQIAQAIGALAFTKLSVEDIIAQYEAPDDDGDEGEVPDEL